MEHRWTDRRTEVSRESVKLPRLVWTLSIFVLMVSLVIDAVPRFSMGDSRSYLDSELHGYLPDDRSWVYGLVAGAVIRLTGDLSSVAVAQIVIMWAAAMSLAHAMVRYFRLDPWFGLMIVLVVVANPLSFFWARSFMTDILAAACFSAMIALLFSERGIVVTATGVFVLAFAICSLRSVYLPPLLLAFATVAALRLLQAARTRQPNFGLRYIVLTITVAAASLGCAKANSAVLHKHEISTNYATTRFLVSAWSPLMAPSVAELGLPAQVTDQMLPLTYDNRLETAFSDNGIVERLKRYYGSFEAAAPAYNQLIRGAILDKPLHFLALVARSWSDYVNPYRVLLYHHDRRMTGTDGYRAPDTLPPDLIARLEGWGIWQQISPELPQVPSIGLSYYADAGGYWVLLIALHATLALPIYLALPRRNRTDDVLAMELFAFAYMGMVAMTTNELVTRYLIPLDIPLLVAAGCLLGRRRHPIAAVTSSSGERERQHSRGAPSADHT